MPRTSWVAVLILAALAVGVGAFLLRQPPASAALDCPPERIHFRDAGSGPLVAYCGDEVADSVPAGAGLAVGRKLDLNKASEADLALVPGVGAQLAQAVVRAREERGGFKSWEEVDELPGIGAAKLELLRTHAEIAGH